jgi:hypothetical protein
MSIVKIHNFENGMTVRELKQIINEWPETTVNGDDVEVCINNCKGFVECVSQLMPFETFDTSETIKAGILLR